MSDPSTLHAEQLAFWNGPGASDAFLMPYHVERGKIMVRARLGPVPYIDEEQVARSIELTRFPVQRPHFPGGARRGQLLFGDGAQVGSPTSWSSRKPFRPA